MKSLSFLLSISLMFFTVSGCGNRKSSGSALPMLANANSPLVTPTYDGSGQAMHPSLVYFPQRWSGYNYWMVMTPYPNNNASFENPSILASNDGTAWVVPQSLVNPIAPKVGAHLDDAELFFDSVSNQLWVYYIEEDLSNFSHVVRRTSSNGVNWSAPVDMFVVPNINVVSPAVQKVNDEYIMWSVNAGPNGCNSTSTTVEYRTSPDGTSWSAPQSANLTQPGQHIWHIEIRYITEKREYWALYAAYPGNSCGSTLLYFAKSTNGIDWSVTGSPIMKTGIDWDHDQIYRSTFLYDSSTDRLRVWYSAQHKHEWHTGYTDGIYRDLKR